MIFPIPIAQETGVGANPVQIEVGDFDEAIEIVEDEVVESKLTQNRNRAVKIGRFEMWSGKVTSVSDQRTSGRVVQGWL